MYQLIGIIMGIASGMIWEELATSKFHNFKTLFPSLLLKEKNEIIHFHHWLLYALILFLICLWGYKTQRLFHPAVLLLLSFFTAAILYNFIKFPDWYKFIN